MQMNGGKPVMWLETDVGSELPLASFNIAHLDLAAVKVENNCFLTTDFSI